MQRIMTVLLIYFVTSCAQAALSPIEQQLRQQIAKDQPAQIQLLKKLVNISSGTTNINGVKRVGDVIAKKLQQLGFKTQWVAEPATMHRAPTLVAERQGKQGKRLLLIAHLDTVFAANSKAQYQQKNPHWATGPGTIDDKGGIIVLLAALQALNHLHALNNTQITIVLTGDEEDSGKPTAISRKPLFAAAKHSDVALDFEPAENVETITVGRRGVSGWTLTTQGQEAHSAGIFQEAVGDGAIFELARILNNMRTTLSSEKNLTFNPGIMMGGTTVHYDAPTAQGAAFGKQNVVAKTAIVSGDYRFISPAQQQQFKNKVTQIVQQHLPGTTATITFKPGIPAMQATENNLALLKQYSDCSVDLSYGQVKPYDPALRGAGDISHIAALVAYNLSGLGPLGLGSHSPSEAIDLTSLPIQTERAAVLIYRLTQ